MRETSRVNPSGNGKGWMAEFGLLLTCVYRYVATSRLNSKLPVSFIAEGVNCVLPRGAEGGIESAEAASDESYEKRN